MWIHEDGTVSSSANKSDIKIGFTVICLLLCCSYSGASVHASNVEDYTARERVWGREKKEPVRKDHRLLTTTQPIRTRASYSGHWTM